MSAPVPLIAPNSEPLQNLLSVQAISDREMKRILVASAKDIARMIQTGYVKGARANQLAELLAQIKKENKTLWRTRIISHILKFYPKVERAARKSEKYTFDILEQTVGESTANALYESVRPNLERNLQVLQARRIKELSPRVWKNQALIDGRIERMIRQSLVQGLSPKELSKKVEQFVRPDTRGGVSYAAMRLARTEINNAFHETQKQEAQDKPWISHCKWNLSKSHPRFDICDEYANGGEGQRGLYDVKGIPDKPHPHCFCYLTYEVVDQHEMMELIANLVIQEEKAS